MALLLKKMWETVSHRSCAKLVNRVVDFPSSASSPCSMGMLDQIPLDVLMMIMKKLGAKEAVKLSLVCRMLRSVVQDSRLWIHFFQNPPQDLHLLPWDSVIFSEINLRLGYPIQTYSSEEMGELSLMRLYGQRVEVPGSVIIDGGSGYCKFGWSKYGWPSGRSATFLEFGNIESPMYSTLRHFFATIYSRMQVKASTQPVVVSIPLSHYDDTESAKASRRQLKEAMHTVLFDMNVPAVCAINQATLALYAARRTSGIVVNIGFQVTSIVPILNGKVMRKVGVEVIGLGALKLTGFLRELMQQNNTNFGSMYTVRTLKENLCYVATDYKAELSKDTRASMQVMGEGWFTLSKERFQTGELLFQPRIAGLRTMGLDQAVSLCMDHCHAADLTGDDAWFKTVVLSGGSACLPGLAERLEKELHVHLPPALSSGIRVIPPPYGADTSWFGAKLISNLSTFPGPWCKIKKQYRRKSRLHLAW
ncbi:Actin domain-containing protein/F-box domain-containing protein [Cephalotus follicularis]|uniref:Actin domain-containing protein/F-box domain-containing protein n=1 Tax=Cephalotus follicularis TaxID=3775 RepID=A0A1Q3C3Z1_CEPFO|nr:Actin domain-containing protein/F-box domain-containing protein [Cephalotus follicularis]